MTVEDTRAGTALADQDERIPHIAVKTLGGSSGALSNASTPADQQGSIFSGVGGMAAPYDPEALGRMYENSAMLRPNVDAYVQNIDGSGHHFEAQIDPEADDADDKIRAAIRVEKMRSVHWRIAAAGAELELFEPTDPEVYERKERLRRLMAFEKARLDAFFEYAARSESFPSLRMKTRQDLEVTGNGSWEILRDSMGDICEFVYVPFYTIRLLPLDKEPAEYKVLAKITPISYEERRAVKRFRRFVQVIDGHTTFFKEFGDRRIMSRKSGRYFPNKAAWDEHARNDRFDGLATEILHFRIHCSTSPYGVPRWIGALTEVLGARSASEVNHNYFDNKAVPPMAILVSGGRLRPENVKALEDHIKNEIKGKQNFHKPLLLEAVSADKPGNPTPADAAKIKIQIIPLMNAAQMKDALFMGYTVLCKGLVREQFRNPPIMVGDSKDYNRATSETAKVFAEDQVYAAPRSEFDDVMNRLVLPDLGISTYRFASNSIVSKNAEQLSTIIEGWVREGIITPEEARLFANDVLGVDLKRIDAEWVSQPWPITLAAAKAQGVGVPNTAGGPNPFGANVEQNADDPQLGIPNLPAPGRDPGNPLASAAAKAGLLAELVALRDTFLAQRHRAAKEAFFGGASNGHAITDEEPERIAVDPALLASWVEPD